MEQEAVVLVEEEGGAILSGGVWGKLPGIQKKY